MVLDETMHEQDGRPQDPGFSGTGLELALMPLWSDYSSSGQDEVLPFFVFDDDDGEGEEMDDNDNFDDMDDDFDDDFDDDEDDFDDEDDDYEDEDEDFDYEEDVDYDDFDE